MPAYMLLTFDLDGEAPYILKKRDYVQVTRGLYGVKTGLYKILQVLDKRRIPATFFISAYVAEMHEKDVYEIARRGHEVASHGYLHEDFSQLSASEAEEVLTKSKNILSKFGSVIGFRAPYWRLEKWLLELLALKGFIYDSSLMDSDFAYTLELGGRKLVEIPVSYHLDDWVLFEEKQFPPDIVLRSWTYELEWCIENETLFVLTAHPQVIGRGSRIRVLDGLLRLAEKLEKVEVTTCRKLAEKLLKPGD